MRICTLYIDFSSFEVFESLLLYNLLSEVDILHLSILLNSTGQSISLKTSGTFLIISTNFIGLLRSTSFLCCFKVFLFEKSYLEILLIASFLWQKNAIWLLIPQREHFLSCLFLYINLKFLPIVLQVILPVNPLSSLIWIFLAQFIRFVFSYKFSGISIISFQFCGNAFFSEWYQNRKF